MGVRRRLAHAYETSDAPAVPGLGRSVWRAGDAGRGPDVASPPKQFGQPFVAVMLRQEPAEKVQMEAVLRGIEPFLLIGSIAGG